MTIAYKNDDQFSQLKTSLHNKKKHEIIEKITIKKLLPRLLPSVYLL